MARKTLINEATGLVVNVVSVPDDWDNSPDQWQVPAGHIVIDIPASPGDTWNGSVIIPRPPPPEPPKPPSREFPAFRGTNLPQVVAELNALRAKLIELGILEDIPAGE